MRFGVVGTGYWAREVHGRGVQAADGAELAGVWGRDAAKRQAVADALQVRPYASYDDLVADVEAVTYAVPPHVQSVLAAQAARDGRHVLLEKPVATDVESARELQRVVDGAGVAAAVFVTAKFTAERREWAAELLDTGPWRGASALWLGAAFGPGSPFDTPWRHEKGALWDVGPHAVAALEDALGPVQRVLTVATGDGDLVHLVLAHEGGATSTATLTISASPQAAGTRLSVWGDGGVVRMPESSQSRAETFATAVDELAAAAAGGPPPTVDLAYGVHLTEVLADVERLLMRPHSGT